MATAFNGARNPASSGQPTSGAAVSALGKVWRFPPDKEIDAEFLAAAEGSELLARLLVRRDVKSAAEARAFLDFSAYTPTCPMELPDVDKAIRRIMQAIAVQEKITVYGDYDVDGVTGTSVLLTVLKKLGAAVDFYIPNRSQEGYGLNLKAVSVLASKHRTKLIITCDCGVSNFAEINFAKSLGVDTLVLDHHSMPEMLPPAVGIVHPKLLAESHPLFNLPGVGVAYKVCEALLIDQGHDSEVDELLDYVTLGMIADMVPLVLENRYLVKLGLPRLLESKRPGIQALLNQVRKTEDTDVVGFGLAPRINAVGRLADAKMAVTLLTTDDPETAETIARQLQNENIKRQELCEKIFLEADKMVSTKIDLANDKAILIYDEGWHHGVVGIVASRLVEKYRRPVFIGELEKQEGIVKGSARSIDSIDLYEVLKANEHLLHKWGGHKMAAGFAVEVEKAAALNRGIVTTCNNMLAGKALNATLEIDFEARPKQVTVATAQLLTKLAPFGMGNKKPHFAMLALQCSSIRLLGKDGKHHRIMVEDPQSGLAFECVMWNTRGNVPQPGEEVDVVFTPEINSYKGVDRLQLVLVDWRNSKIGNQAQIDTGADMTAPVIAALDALQSNVQTGAAVGDSSFSEKRDNHEKLERIVQIVPASADDEEAASEADIGEPPSPRTASSAAFSRKITWKDLRSYGPNTEVIERAREKFRADLKVFSETGTKFSGIEFVDRTQLARTRHLLLWQFPPSLNALQEMIAKAAPETIYLMAGAGANEPLDDPSSFLKKLLGLIRYAVNKLDGQVPGEKLAAATGASKMTIALGLTLLRKANLVEWFSEDGLLFLDITGPAIGNMEELPEFKQLANSLQSTKEFREWCLSASMKAIQLAVLPNQIGLAPYADAPEQSVAPLESELHQQQD
ncbi:MAG TPA: single-stranded-DNA-specific exonuclease RecJ [Chroococcales cyanobacterium]